VGKEFFLKFSEKKTEQPIGPINFISSHLKNKTKTL
jgi:hypothetical protein